MSSGVWVNKQFALWSYHTLPLSDRQTYSTVSFYLNINTTLLHSMQTAAPSYYSYARMIETPHSMLFSNTAFLTHAFFFSCRSYRTSYCVMKVHNNFIECIVYVQWNTFSSDMTLTFIHFYIL